MAADFWAGYISGAAGIIIGNPLDVLKVRLQASSSASAPPTSPTTTTTPYTTSTTPSLQPTTPKPKNPGRIFLLGTAAPVLTYGALNALLFVSYNRTERLLNDIIFTPSNPASPSSSSGGPGTSLCATWLAGAAGGLATWVVSTPTELVKCRAQLLEPPPPSIVPSMSRSSSSSSSSLSLSSSSSWRIAKQVLQTEGVRGLYFGGAVTALRDSVGYGFYFWAYELASRWWLTAAAANHAASGGVGAGWLDGEAARVLLCGGLAGVVTWASVFPLDVIKTRVQTQTQTTLEGGPFGERRALLPGGDGQPQEQDGSGRRKKMPGAWEVAKETYREGGIKPFFRGLGVCSVRAFIVNAVQWAVYEWIMTELGQGRRRGDASGSPAAAVAAGEFGVDAG
ncbi:mitochondrial carrier [Canariomyces notabilis]|uniref:Mitochondrial carrier n=1 Tax=Canariomyces notabilis TaxID=2074819 RepID=A0AAN6QG97_9PEZI|nr:mitochondrial carrier [Canariomyces arenarius]